MKIYGERTAYSATRKLVPNGKEGARNKTRILV
jgi:hypothetical protein